MVEKSPDLVFKKFAHTLAILNKSALPLAARGTLNQLAFETRMRVVNKEMPKQFTIRNTHEQKAVRFKRCDNTFDLNKMESSAGQLSVVKFGRGPKAFKDLRQQELGETLGPRPGHKLVRTPTTRARVSRSANRPVSRVNRPSKGQKWLGMKDLEKVGRKGKKAFTGGGRMSVGARISRAHAIAVRITKGRMYLLPLMKKRHVLGAFRVISKKITLMHTLSPKKKKLKKRPTIKPGYMGVMKTRADAIWEQNVHHRVLKEIEKAFKF